MIRSSGSGSDVRLELYGGDYEHTIGLDGQYGNLHVDYFPRPVVEIFREMISRRAFAACEMSLANYVVMRDRGARWLTALPIFPFRAFRHGAIYVRADSGLSRLSDVLGLRMGVPDYGMTAAVWVRGILKSEYGVSWDSLRWYSRASRIPLPAALQVDRLSHPLGVALENHEIDAAVSTTKLVGTTNPLRRLLSDPATVEREYFGKTGIFPIMHVVVVKQDALDRHPDIATGLFSAYVSSKRSALQRRLSRALHPWGYLHWETVDEHFGGDPLPHGLSALNRRAITVFLEFLRDQRLINDLPHLESLFADGSIALSEVEAHSDVGR